jgi:hypothetical protein
MTSIILHQSDIEVLSIYNMRKHASQPSLNSSEDAPSVFRVPDAVAMQEKQTP